MTDSKVIMKDWLPPSRRNQKLHSLRMLRIHAGYQNITKLIPSVFCSHPCQTYPQLYFNSPGYLLYFILFPNLISKRICFRVLQFTFPSEY